MGAGFQPYQQLAASGSQQQAREQALIRDAQEQHQFEQNLPYQQLQNYQSGITGYGPVIPGGTTTGTAPGATLLENLGGILSGVGTIIA